MNISKQLAPLRTKLDQVPALVKAEEVSNIPKEYLVVSGGSLLFAFIFFQTGAGALCSITGFAYPALKSFQAIESNVRGDDTQWLIYWVFYSFFHIIEAFEDFLIYWVPFYYAFKLAFLLWAMLPQTKGAKFLYDSFIKDFLKKNESRIDAALDEAKRSMTSVAAEVAAATAEISAAGLKSAAEYAQREGSSKNSKKD
jgi:receptor expression-enhancing protein 5/6